MLNVPAFGLMRAAVRRLGDEAAFLHTEFASWCVKNGASPGGVRDGLLSYLRKGEPNAHARVARRLEILRRCDAEGDSHKSVAAHLGLSRAHFYRERRLAIEHLGSVVSRIVGHPDAMTGGLARRGSVQELRELRAALELGPRANSVINALRRETQAAIEMLEGRDHGPIAL